MTAHLCKGCIINQNQGGGSKKAGLSTTVGFTKRSKRFMNMKKFKNTNNFFIKYVLEFIKFFIKKKGKEGKALDPSEIIIMMQLLNDLFTKHIPANPFSPQSDRALASFSNDTKKITEGLENEISFNSPTSNKMYKDMNNVFSSFRTLIIEYLKHPNEQRRARIIQAIQTHENNVELFKNYLFILIGLWSEGVIGVEA